MGNYEVAQDYARRAIEHNRQDRFLAERVKSLYVLGEAYFYAGDLEGAKRAYQEAVTLVRQYGPINDMDDYALGRLGHVVLEQGDLAGAEACARQLLEKHPRPEGFQVGALELLGRVATARGDFVQAGLWLNRAIEESLEDCGGLDNLDDSWDFWSVLLHVCDLRLAQGRFGEAAAVLGFLQPRLRDPFDKTLLERRLAAIGAVLPPEALEQALVAGAGLELKDILGDILAEPVSPRTAG